MNKGNNRSMTKIKIFDSAFLPGTKSASIGGDNLGVGPTHFSWRQEVPLTFPTFFTDSHITDVAMFGGGKHFIGWLLEPRSLRFDHYREARAYKDLFGTILTYDAELLEVDGFEFYPYGGSWIAFDQWGMHEKTKNISIIASDKNTSEGHKLRHEIIKRFGDQIDVYGSGYNPIQSKFEALAPYRYSIVVESGRFDYYFTEKLIDCLSVGTIPIYWGCPSIGKFFDEQGFCQFETMDNLWFIFNALGIHRGISGTIEAMYKSYLGTGIIKSNLKSAWQYRICEDWIWDNYPELFGRPNA